MAYHVMLGLLWAWFLRELWNELNPLWIWTAVIGSVLPDIDHFNYFFGYGKRDAYTQQIVSFLRQRQWRSLVQYIAKGHKTNTSLQYHNIYVAGIFLAGSIISAFIDWRFGVVLFGAIVSHYVFDIFDDIVLLGSINENWGRWGRPKKA